MRLIYVDDEGNLIEDYSKLPLYNKPDPLDCDYKSVINNDQNRTPLNMNKINLNQVNKMRRISREPSRKSLTMI